MLDKQRIQALLAETKKLSLLLESAFDALQNEGSITRSNTRTGRPQQPHTKDEENAIYENLQSFRNAADALLRQNPKFISRPTSSTLESVPENHSTNNESQEAVHQRQPDLLEDTRVADSNQSNGTHLQATGSDPVKNPENPQGGHPEALDSVQAEDSNQGEDSDPPEPFDQDENSNPPGSSHQGEDSNPPEPFDQDENSNPPESSHQGEDPNPPEPADQGEDPNLPESSNQGEDPNLPESSNQGEDPNPPEPSDQGEDSDSPEPSDQDEDADRDDDFRTSSSFKRKRRRRLSRTKAICSSQARPAKDIDLRSPLRYKCDSSELGQEMVSTIMKARNQLGPNAVDERGYLILETKASCPISELSQLLRTSTPPEDTDIRGFTFERGASDFMHAYIDGEAPRIYPDIADLRDTFSTPTDPISEFKQWVENPPDRVAYLVCPPLKEHAINNLLDAGIRSSSRPPLPGFNELYWYVSFEANTPAPLHVEDGGAGLANLLVGGVDKRWLVIHRSSASKLEQCVRKEFRQPKPCSQFVRHYNLILSPSWLEERGISYEIVTHRAGEMLVTLPGLTYHQVCNTGCNFAVAINFEFPDAPDIPTGYKWCQKGARKCGEFVITLDSFLPTTDTASKDKGNDEGAHRQLPEFLLPKEDSNPVKDVENLIQACLNQRLTPQLFDCANEQQLEKRLRCFAPGAQLDDSLLHQLLQLIALPNQFLVVESLNFDVRMPNVNEIMARTGWDMDGLVLPFHVNDHWAMAIFNLRTHTLVTFDLEDCIGQKWACAFEEALKKADETSPTIKTSTGTVPRNPDGASCALCCCLALDQYFGNHPVVSTDLRSHYLRRLLKAYQLTIPYSQLLGRPLTSPSLSDLRSVNLSFDLANETHYDHQTRQECLAATTLPQDLLQAIVTDRDARIMQMIMECSLEDSKYDSREITPSTQICTPSAPEIRDIKDVMQDLDRSAREFSLPILRRRVLFMEIDFIFRDQLRKEQRDMDHTRQIRKRAKARGERLDPLPDGGKTVRIRALEKLAESLGNTKAATQKERAHLRTCIQYGATLNDIGFRLGFGVLLALPTSTVDACNLKLSLLCCKGLESPLEPTEYHTMKLEEKELFISWLPRVRSELDRWNEIALTQGWLDKLSFGQVVNKPLQKLPLKRKRG